MLDSDLAMLYQVETGRLNEAVKRNIFRFPEHFRFQLSKEEYTALISQFAISNTETDSVRRGGRRKLPYVFTEQGIAMLSAILKSETAIKVSIRIMETFVEMRKYMANASLLYEKLNALELRQLTFEENTDAKFEKVFDYIASHEASTQKVFFDGQIYDAFSLISGLIQKATTDIILIDGYVGTGTLDLLSKKQAGVHVEIYTSQRGCQLTNTEIAAFNTQYPSLCIYYMPNFHDRFLILDHTVGYHVGASIKDAGKKCFAITLLEDPQIIQDIISHL